MRASLIPVLMAIALASAPATHAAPIDDILVPPPGLPIILISFDDREEGTPHVDVITSPSGLLEGRLTIIPAGVGEGSIVNIDNILAEPVARGSEDSFALLDGREPRVISDFVTFRTFQTAPTDLSISFRMMRAGWGSEVRLDCIISYSTGWMVRAQTFSSFLSRHFYPPWSMARCCL